MYIKTPENGFTKDYKSLKLAKYEGKKESGINQYTFNTSFSKDIFIVMDEIYPENGILQKNGSNTFIEFELMLNKDKKLPDNHIVTTKLLGNSIITDEDAITYFESPTINGSKAKNKIDITQYAKAGNYKDGILYLHVYYPNSDYVSRYGLKIDLNTGLVSNYEFFINNNIGNKPVKEGVQSELTKTEVLNKLKPPVIVVDKASHMEVDIANGIILKYMGPDGYDVPSRIEIPSSIQGTEIKKIVDRAFVNLGADTATTIVTIPNTVTTLEGSAFWGANITELTIPDSITVIPDALAYGCSQLKTVNLPNGITSIGDDSFGRCVKLETINIPNGVTEIGSNAFDGVPAFDNLANNGFLIVNNILMLYDGTEKNVVIPEGITSISKTAFGIEYTKHGSFGNTGFNKHKEIASITFPSSLKVIGDYAFAGISTLEKVNFNAGLESIGNGAFYDCKNLKTIDLPSKLISIGDYAFGSTGLTKITTPNSLKSIGDYAFAYNQIASINLSDNITHVGAYAFHVEREYAKYAYGHEAGYSKVNAIPKNLKNVGEYAFKDCSFSKGFVIPKSLTDIKTGFAYTKIDGKLTVPGHYIKIPDKAFEHSEFKDLIIESGVKEIGNESFAYCKLLKTASLPNTLVSIGDKAFAACYNLEVRIPKSVISLPGSAFYESKIIK